MAEYAKTGSLTYLATMRRQTRDLTTRAPLYNSIHSTESAVLCVLSDILNAVDRGDFSALVLLDLSAAFDTVDHDILLQRLELSFGIADVARD